MTSIERIVEYNNLPNEHLHSSVLKKPEENWPCDGKITFKNVTLSYSASLPPVLKNLSLEILPSEKIGIIGRTGAGIKRFFVKNIISE